MENTYYTRFYSFTASERWYAGSEGSAAHESFPLSQNGQKRLPIDPTYLNTEDNRQIECNERRKQHDVVLIEAGGIRDPSEATSQDMMRSSEDVIHILSERLHER